MKGAILIFSNTGNTKLACERIKAKAKNVEFSLFNMRDGYVDLTEYGIVGFATYASEFKVARFVTDYMAKLPEYKDKPAFVFTTYGRGGISHQIAIFCGAKVRISEQNAK